MENDEDNLILQDAELVEGSSLGHERFLLDGGHQLPLNNPHEHQPLSLGGTNTSSTKIPKRGVVYYERFNVPYISHITEWRELSEQLISKVDDAFHPPSLVPVEPIPQLIFDSLGRPMKMSETDKEEPYVRLQENPGEIPWNVNLVAVAETIQDRAVVVSPSDLLDNAIEKVVPKVFKALSSLKGENIVVTVLLPDYSEETAMDPGQKSSHPTFELWFFLHFWEYALPKIEPLYPHIYFIREIDSIPSVIKTLKTDVLCVIRTIPTIADSLDIEWCREHAALLSQSIAPAPQIKSILVTGACPRQQSFENTTIVGYVFESFGDALLKGGLPVDQRDLIHDVRNYRIPPRLNKPPRDMQWFLGQWPREKNTLIPVFAGYSRSRYEQHPCFQGFAPLLLQSWQVDRNPRSRKTFIKFE
jgi:hypothetical protein